jgi:hypothetical protein
MFGLRILQRYSCDGHVPSTSLGSFTGEVLGYFDWGRAQIKDAPNNWELKKFQCLPCQIMTSSMNGWRKEGGYQEILKESVLYLVSRFSRMWQSFRTFTIHNFRFVQAKKAAKSKVE